MDSLHRLRVGQQDIGLLANRGILSKQMGAFAVRLGGLDLRGSLEESARICRGCDNSCAADSSA